MSFALQTERLRRQQTEEELEGLKGQLSSSEGELDELYEVWTPCYKLVEAATS